MPTYIYSGSGITKRRTLVVASRDSKEEHEAFGKTLSERTSFIKYLNHLESEAIQKLSSSGLAEIQSYVKGQTLSDVIEGHDEFSQIGFAVAALADVRLLRKYIENVDTLAIAQTAFSLGCRVQGMVMKQSYE